jgi:hypothetical protein
LDFAHTFVTRRCHNNLASECIKFRNTNGRSLTSEELKELMGMFADRVRDQDERKRKPEAKPSVGSKRRK